MPKLSYVLSTPSVVLSTRSTFNLTGHWSCELSRCVYILMRPRLAVMSSAKAGLVQFSLA